MKKLALIIGLGFIAALLVAAGFWLGFSQHFKNEAHPVTALDKNLTDALRTVMLLEEIDTGQLDDAKHSLRLELDAQVLSVDALLDSADDHRRELARKIFTRIARYQAEHPFNYTGQLAQPDPTVTAKVDSILKRASESQK